MGGYRTRLSYHYEDKGGIGRIGRACGQDSHNEHEAVERLADGAVDERHRARGFALPHSIRAAHPQPSDCLL